MQKRRVSRGNKSPEGKNPSKRTRKLNPRHVQKTVTGKKPGNAHDEITAGVETPQGRRKGRGWENDGRSRANKCCRTTENYQENQAAQMKHATSKENSIPKIPRAKTGAFRANRPKQPCFKNTNRLMLMVRYVHPIFIRIYVRSEKKTGEGIFSKVKPSAPKIQRSPFLSPSEGNGVQKRRVSRGNKSPEGKNPSKRTRKLNPRHVQKTVTGKKWGNAKKPKSFSRPAKIGEQPKIHRETHRHAI